MTILIGMFDSPFVRRVALTMRFQGLSYEHRNWSVGKDQALIRQYNPVGRVPTLVLDDGEVLIESSAILDYLDDRAGPERALLPAAGAERRRALQLMALAIGAAEKGVQQIYEREFRPPEKWHQPWVDRLRGQMDDALRMLDAACADCAGAAGLVGDRMTQADITATVVHTLLADALPLPPAAYPALAAHAAHFEALPEFAAIRVPFFRPSQVAATAQA